jgi:hypothetical protein
VKICPLGPELVCGQIDMMDIMGTFYKYGDTPKNGAALKYLGITELF